MTSPFAPDDDGDVAADADPAGSAMLPAHLRPTAPAPESPPAEPLPWETEAAAPGSSLPQPMPWETAPVEVPPTEAHRQVFVTDVPTATPTAPAPAPVPVGRPPRRTPAEWIWDFFTIRFREYRASRKRWLRRGRPYRYTPLWRRVVALAGMSLFTVLFALVLAGLVGAAIAAVAIALQSAIS